MNGLRSIVALAKESMRGIEPASITEGLPEFEWINPRDLFVEEVYQRDLSENSIGLIRRIIAGWSWARFKTPVCVRISEWDGVLVCIDGQHTAIAAASHPAIEKIPVMIVDAGTVAARASAFVGHNRDRIALTQMAIFYGELASGDALAQAVDRACQAAGAKILNKSINLRQRAPVGATIAVGTIRNIAKRQGEEFLARVLGILTRAGRGPIKADEIAAVALMIERAPGCADRLQSVIASKSAEQWAALAAVKAAAAGGRRGAASDALASLWASELGSRLAPAAKPEPKRGLPAPERAKPAPSIAAPRPVPAPPVRQPPPAASKPQPMPASAPAPSPAPPAASNVVEWHGIRIDTGQGTVHAPGGQTETSTDGAKLLALLARVKPSFLEGADLMQKLALDAFRLRTLVGRVNADMAGVGLIIRNVMKTGWMLADLD